jgi:hypothetical protein
MSRRRLLALRHAVRCVRIAQQYARNPHWG